MNRVFKFQANVEATNPTDYRFQGLQTLEPDPNMFVQLGAFDKFRFAAMGRNIEDFYAITPVSGAPKRDLGGQPNSGTPARVLVGPCPAIEHGTSPFMRQDDTPRMVNELSLTCCCQGRVCAVII